MASTKKTTKAEENSALDFNMDDFKFELELPITFEGTVYKQITLKGLWDLDLQGLTEVDREYKRLTGITMTANTPVDTMYSALVVAKANGMPYEWLMKLKARDAIRLRTSVFTFFYMRAQRKQDLKSLWQRQQ